MSQNNKSSAENKSKDEIEVNGIKMDLKFSDKLESATQDLVLYLLIKNYESRVAKSTID